ncbi:MurR/RpiR family transcriptional regulator [Tuanshanicoccus lijuaniae]|uniref:MurR/RpiR family transcriptional regulator n=1 Tax=Aerococcaceae bacterium zg-1292 TaxID=2774330 RepID=UPI001BD83374|nr:MurR/RpiR family transcriptional regulator [Aerococcaceae bacterium zg-A91]MBS4457769.1 MurR/RpiR family transcriptional regulator [Aerococcaceae bacterium zg-BR33]
MDNVSLLTTLLKYMNELDANKTQFSVAKGMLKNFKQIPEMSIYDLADHCFVSPASISRFVKSIGFASYSDFKKECKEYIDIDVDYSSHVHKAQGNDVKPLFENYTNNAKENLDYNLHHIDMDQIEKVSDWIYEADDVVFLGLEFATILGQHYQKKMAECSKYVHLPWTFEQQKEVVSDFSNKSVAIIASLEGGYFYRSNEVIRILKSKDAKIIAITMEHNSKILRDADEIILCNRNNSETEGRLSLLHIIELLIMYYFINYK